MLVSVIVPCRNERDHILQTIRTIESQDGAGFDTEAIIADGMSTDGTQEMVKGYESRLVRLRLISNPGRIVSTGLNAALREASGEIVLRMDAHTVYANDYIKQCVEVLNETRADCVGGPWVAKGTGAFARLSACAFQNWFCVGTRTGHNPGYEGPVDTVYLGCWRKQVFETIGLFDETLVRNQDDELNLRIRQRGGLVWQSSRIRSHYVPRNSWPALFRQYWQYGYWKVRILRKHRRTGSWRHAVPALAVAAAAGLAVVVALGTAAGSSAVVMLSGRTFGFLAAVYLAGAILAAATAQVEDGLSARFALPAIFVTYHVAYGCGYLHGIADWIFSKPTAGQSSKESFVSTLTR
jgi:succinoglycan biosynthesis protein ExoA